MDVLDVSSDKYSVHTINAASNVPASTALIAATCHRRDDGEKGERFSSNGERSTRLNPGDIVQLGQDTKSELDTTLQLVKVLSWNRKTQPVRSLALIEHS
mmetsp:Transcript_9371/g.18722  ORF Transcript_9371/g.18722 Transcript_9371/m.18722 type:complete len:100 (-) Transcript_9371:9-308(-)